LLQDRHFPSETLPLSSLSQLFEIFLLESAVFLFQSELMLLSLLEGLDCLLGPFKFLHDFPVAIVSILPLLLLPLSDLLPFGFLE
jgi:hypothetical protein